MAKTKMQKDSVIFYRSFYESIKELPLEQQAEVYNAVFEFGLNGIEPKTSGVAKSILALIKPRLTANNARSSNGKKGGRPKKEEPETEPNKKQTETKQKPNQNLDKTETKPSNNLDETKREPNKKQTEPTANQTETKFKIKEKEKSSKKEIENLGLDVEDISIARARDKGETAEVIHKHLTEVCHSEQQRQYLVASEVFADRVPLYDQYVKALEKADTPLKVAALQKIDDVEFARMFNALWKCHDIRDVYRYVWKSVLAYARHHGGV